MRKVLLTLALLLITTPVAANAVTEDWNCGDSTTINCDLTWTERVHDFEITSSTVNRVIGGGLTVATTSDVSGGDSFSAQVDVKLVANEAQGLVWHYADTDNYYYAVVDDFLNRVALLKREGGGDSPLCSNATTVTPTPTYEIRVEVVAGVDITVYLDDVEQCSVSDSSLPPTDVFGIISNNAGGGGGADGGTFDNLSVETLTNSGVPMIKSKDCGMQLVNGGMVN